MKSGVKNLAQKGHPKVEVAKHENYRTIIVNGVLGGLRPGFFEAIVYTDEVVGDEALSTALSSPEKAYIKRTIQCRLVFDPFQAKSLAQWLTNNVKEYEKLFGKIPTSNELEKEKGKAASTYIK